MHCPWADPKENIPNDVGCSDREVLQGCTEGVWRCPSPLTLTLAGTPWAGQGCEAVGGCTALGPTMPCTLS